MLVDNPVQQQQQSSSFFSPLPDMMTNDISQFLNTELFMSATSPSSASAGTSSRSSSPHDSVTTPPQASLPTSFPDIQDASSAAAFNYPSSGFSLGSGYNGTGSLFNFFDDEFKPIDPVTSPSYDFLESLSGGGGGGSGVSAAPTTITAMDLDSLLSMTSPAASTSSSSNIMAIDPQLVGTPSSHDMSDDSDDGSDEEEDSKPNKAKEEKLTLTIAPVKVAGHGKARKGTVQGGGVSKKLPSSSASLASTTSLSSLTSSAPTPSSYLSSALAKDKENLSGKRSSSGSVKGAPPSVLGIDEDELPEDWRPPPEVFQKMSSKEKRQLRNKISARNFRVRRKEYISTLEMDIAERDRLLNAIRSELGSTQSENLALRQEIGALKKALLEGRTGALTSDDVPVLNLPPPAPIPLLSDKPSASSATAASSGALLTPNTHKDLPVTASSTTSPRLNAFWGGVGIGTGGGYTPVHTVLMPELRILAGGASRGLQENLNPALNASEPVDLTLGRNANTQQAPVEDPAAQFVGKGSGMVGGFDGFADMNPFTMKTLDAYRMQLWTKMASQQGHHHQHPHPHAHPHQHASSSTSSSSSSSSSGSPSPQLPTLIAPHAISPSASAAAAAHIGSMRMGAITPPPLIGSPSPFTINNGSGASPSPSNSPLHLPLGLGFGLYGNVLSNVHNPNPAPAPNTNTNLNGTGLSGLASNMAPKYLTASNKANLPSSSSTSSSSSSNQYSWSSGSNNSNSPPLPSRDLSSLLAGKHSSSSYSSSPYLPRSYPSYPSSSTSASLAGKDSSAGLSQQREREKEQQQQAVFAALASQTLLKKLGSAFWDAFSGGSSASASTSSSASTSTSAASASTMKNWDEEKVRKVLEGKAVVRVVDLEPTPTPTPSTPAVSAATTTQPAPASPKVAATPSCAGSQCLTAGSQCLTAGSQCLTAMLEESMGSLSLGKK